MKLTRQAVICAMLIGLGWQGSALAGDMLLIHGHIYTGNPRAPWASALSVSGTRIEAVGTDAAILK
jgi:predicted dinucleotide-binding enzyme